ITDEIESFYGNAAPVPVDDVYTLDEDTQFFTVPAPGVLANDLDADGDPLTAELLTTTSHGTLAFQPNGSFIYATGPDYFGTDSFTYRAHDFRGSEIVATVTLQIMPTYDP